MLFSGTGDQKGYDPSDLSDSDSGLYDGFPDGAYVNTAEDDPAYEAYVEFAGRPYPPRGAAFIPCYAGRRRKCAAPRARRG